MNTTSHMEKSVPAKLKIKNITKSFLNNGITKNVLNNINFEVNEGEFICILGSSGCGKSTLLRHIAGFETAECGSILLDGNIVSGPKPDRVMVFQDFNQLLPWKTVLQNVMFPLKTGNFRYSNKDMIQIAQSYLNMVQLSGFDNYYPHQLSGGMKQKAAIARALVQNPKVLLMDEPFGSLDAQAKDVLQKELIKIWEDTGITILFVTHDIQEAIILSNRIIVMDKSSGSIKEIMDNTITRPRTPSSSGFINLWQHIHDLLKADII